ncbi:YchJ family protein [uncultured Pseudokineococcus sp.]|uniref:YchJ family protein n=1 Tax=uncultured Pseudokineococcus sp. TaxID=1642928 RepID=UPI00261526C6|nr:YchJ family metal-binding protein [uncultured Pseudokineococcus sp.]
MPALDGSAPCPCGWGEPYAACCRPLHRQEGEAPTAEALMRSRYSAFAVGDAPHLRRTWHAGARPDELDLDEDVRWLHLAVLDVERGGPFDDEGVVEFEAVARVDGRRHVQRERSAFVREGGRWLYAGPA